MAIALQARRPADAPRPLWLFASLWSLRQYPSRAREWSWEKKFRVIRKAGFDGVFSPPLPVLSERGDLRYLAVTSLDAPAKVAPVLRAAKKLGALGIDVLLGNCNTSPTDAVTLAVRIRDVACELARKYYVEAVRRLHAAGKHVAVHIDGRLRGALEMIRATGADCADAVTPTPMGDLSPAQCREEAGPDFILSGGVAPTLWLPRVPIETFRAGVLDWLALKASSSRLIVNAGDQVPPDAEESRIALMRELVEEFGRYDPPD